MTEKRWLYFALGVTTVISVGAVTNQIVPQRTEPGIVISDTAITFADGSVQTTAAQAMVDPRRAFYLTQSTYTGSQAGGSDGNGAGSCAPYFHFASIWEIREVSFLRYASNAEGAGDVRRNGDSGEGPPTWDTGWIRTGFSSATDIGSGTSKCDGWASSSGGHYGTSAHLETSWWSSAQNVPISPWSSASGQCSMSLPIWCVEDYPGAAG